MEERQELNLNTDHNVYILGAGFSVDAGLPVIADFMNTMRDGISWLQAQQRLAEARAVERVLEFRRRAAGAAERIPLDLENIEEIFSLASSSGDSTLMQSATLAIAATLDYAETRKEKERVSINVIEKTPLPEGWSFQNAKMSVGGGPGLQAVSLPLYDLFLLTLSGGPTDLPKDRRDTIITFNYDLLVEKALRNLGVPFDYCIRDSKAHFDGSFVQIKTSRPAVPVLKLHGSMNWWAFSSQWLDIYGDYSDVNKVSALGPMLVPPTWNKTFGPALSDVWDSAVKALSTATRIIVIGYSIPESDNYFKYLLATGLQEDVSLRKIIFVNPDKEGISRRIEPLFRPELRSRIVEVIPVDTRGFLTQLRHHI